MTGWRRRFASPGDWRGTGDGGRSRRFRPPRRRSTRLRKLADYLLIPTLLLLLALVSGRIGGVGGVRLDGNAAIHDGDTITVAGERLRLRGIDAPELSQTCGGGSVYPCGERARRALRALVGGRSVSCTGLERDRYDRLLVTCTAGGAELNRAMVEQGWALAYGDYSDAEAAARARGAGLWAGTFERPQDWRAQHGGMVEAAHDPLRAIWSWLRQLFRFS